jgi:hypothetical protein
MIKKNDLIQMILAAVIITGFFALLILLILHDVPEKNQELLYLVVGALIGSFSAVVGYYFGSSAGSAAKTELLKSKDDKPC